MPRLIHTLMIAFLSLLLAPASLAEWTDPTPLILQDNHSYPASTHWQYLPYKRLTAAEAHAELHKLNSTTGWLNSHEQYLNLGVGQGGYWLRMRISSERESEWHLWNHYSLLDLVILFQCPTEVTEADQCFTSTGGDRIPYSDRPVDHPNLILPLELPPGETYDLYLYVTTEGTYQLPMEFVDQEALTNKLVSNSVFRGAYYAIMLVMALYNLVLFFAVRDRLYLYYTAFVTSFLFFHLNFEGAAYGYFWPSSPDLNGFMVPLSFAISQFFFALFLPQLLNLQHYSPRAALVYRIFVPVTLAFAVLSFTAPYLIAISIQNYVNSALAIYTLIVGIKTWSLGSKPGKYFTLAWIAFVTGVIAANLSAQGVFPGTPLVLYGYQIGSVFDVILISLAMGARINVLNEAREKGQRELTSSQEQAIRYLKQYEDLYRNSIAGRFQLNGQGEVIGCNPAFAKSLGFHSADEVIQQRPHFDQLIESPHASVELWETLNRDAKISGYELTLMPRRGNQVHAILTMRREQADSSTLWIGSFIDVTEKYERESEVKRLQNSRTLSLEQLVMGISHEMNTPLGNIRLANTHLQDCLSADGETDRNDDISDEVNLAVAQVSENINRLAELNQLIQSSMGGGTSHHPDDIYLRAWLRDWEQRAHKRYPQLVTEVISHPDTALWKGYASLLDRILLQLADNSVFHNPEKYDEGTLYLRVSAALTGNILSIQVQDNGRGVSKDEQEKVFLPFYTTKRSAATKKGLGLYEVQNLVTNIMKGSIDCPDAAQGFAVHLALPDMQAFGLLTEETSGQASW